MQIMVKQFIISFNNKGYVKFGEFQVQNIK